MTETFIIDAYNVMRFFVSAEELAASLEKSRRALEARLKAFRRIMGPGTRIILVYDGAKGALPPGPAENGFEVRFSRPPQKADDVVLELGWRLEGAPGLHVVTSDFSDIALKIRRLRLKHWTSAEFARFVQKRVAMGPSSGEKLDGGKPRTASSFEAEEWVRKFGFGDDEAKGDGGKAEETRR